MTPQRRRIDQVLDPEFVSDLSEADLDTLRERRSVTDEVETELSYYRRMLHGRMDLLAFEARRRSGEETRTLLEALPEILGGGETTGGGGETTGGGTVHRPGALAPNLPLIGHRPIDRVLDDDFLSRLPDLTDAEISEIQEMLSSAERDVSADRRKVQGVFDELQAEILLRYKEGLVEAEDLS